MFFSRHSTDPPPHPLTLYFSPVIYTLCSSRFKFMALFELIGELFSAKRNYSDSKCKYKQKRVSP